MSNSFYTADGRKVMLENFADAVNTPTVDDSLRLRGNLSLDGNIRARKYILEDGSEMKQIVQEQTMTALPKSVVFDTQGNMVVNGGVDVKGDLKTTKLCIGDKCADQNSFMAATDGGNRGFDTIRARAGDNGTIQNPNGELRINRQGIMFGGPNAAGKEINSAQITAGLHAANSLNLVGMSSGAGHQDRKIDMWHEGGLTLRGPVNASGGDFRIADRLCVGDKCADANTFMSSSDGGNRGFDTIRARAGDNGTIQNPNGELRINRQGIMFGGPNAAGKEVNSAQITAGLHAPNSLNLVGMSSGAGHQDRKIDMWHEGGLNLRGPVSLNDGRLRLRGIGDPNHELGWSGDVDGPVLSGLQGGKLRSSSTNMDALRWDNQGNIIIKGNLIFEHPNGQRWVMGMRDSNHFAINKWNERGMLVRNDGKLWGHHADAPIVYQGTNDQNWLNDWTHNQNRGRR